MWILYLNLCFFLFFAFLFDIKAKDNNNSSNNSIVNIEIEQNAGILVIDDSLLRGLIGYYDAFLVHFYMPWSVMSQAIAPEYAKLAYYNKVKGINFPLCEIDASVNEKYSKLLNIETYPSIYLIFNGTFILYNGFFSYEKMNEFIKSVINGAFEQFESIEEIDAYIITEKRVLLSTIDESDAGYISFKKIALIKGTEIKMIYCSSEQCKKYYNTSLVLFKSFDERIIKYTQNEDNNNNTLTFNEINMFIGNHTVEHGGILEQYGLTAVFEYHKHVLLYVRDSKNATQVAKDELIKLIGTKYKEIFYCFVLDIKGSKVFEATANYFDIQKSDLPVIMINNMTYNNKVKSYTMNRYITERFDYIAIDNFINDYLNNRLTKDSKSQMRFVINKISGATIVIGKTFNKVVINSNVNNVVLFYDLLCKGLDDCNNLLKLWDVLGDKYNNNTDIQFCTFNSDLNEVNGKEPFDTYPQIVLYAKNHKDTPIIYTKAHKSDLIEKWIKTTIDSNK